MIEVRCATKSYLNKPALNDFSFVFDAGESYALLGTNGAGKSTLIKSMMGLVKLDQGEVMLHQSCAYLSEQPHLPDTMTPWQLMQHACRVYNVDSYVCKDLLEEVHLKESAWHQHISKCSKGMKQRVSIAYTLVGDPSWLVLDEPMSGLDVMGRSLVLDILRKRYEKGCGIIMCSHSVADITKLCKKVLIIVGGELKEVITVKEASLEESDSLEKRLKYWCGNDEVAN